MAISTISITAKSNGNLVSQTTGDNKIYQGAINTTQYDLTIEGMTLLSTDTVYICFTRPDNVVGRIKMTYVSGTQARLLSNGFETDVDISNSNILKISFKVQRHDLNGGLIFDRPTGQLEQVIYESEGWTPQDISAGAESVLTAGQTALEANKWGRYDVSADMIEYLPVDVSFSADGIKTINNFYFNSEHTINAEALTGLLAVYAEDYTDEDNYTQCEIFYNNGSIYTRTITIVSGAVGVVGAWVENVGAKFDELIADYYTKTEIDTNHYTKTEIDTNNYTKTEIDTNIYTKTQIDTNIYTKTQIDTNIYTKGQTNSAVTTATNLIWLQLEKQLDIRTTSYPAGYELQYDSQEANPNTTDIEQYLYNKGYIYKSIFILENQIPDESGFLTAEEITDNMLKMEIEFFSYSLTDCFTVVGYVKENKSFDVTVITIDSDVIFEQSVFGKFTSPKIAVVFPDGHSATDNLIIYSDQYVDDITISKINFYHIINYTLVVN